MTPDLLYGSNQTWTNSMWYIESLVLLHQQRFPMDDQLHPIQHLFPPVTPSGSLNHMLTLSHSRTASPPTRRTGSPHINWRKKMKNTTNLQLHNIALHLSLLACATDRENPRRRKTPKSCQWQNWFSIQDDNLATMWPNSPPTDRPGTKTAQLQAIKSISKSVRLTSDRPVENTHRHIKSSTKRGQSCNRQAKASKSYFVIQQSRTMSACQCSLQIGTFANSLHQYRENTQTRGSKFVKGC